MGRKTRAIRGRVYALALGVLMGLFGVQGTAHAAAVCDYYASPTGTGDGRLVSTPFKIANFWSKATPGSTLCLLDGTYTGADSMIDPPNCVSGALGQVITVRAINDGAVTINGQGRFTPVYLYYNNYFVLEGFNAHSSNSTVVKISNSEHNIVRRVAAWDAADENTEIFGAHYSKDTLWEDVAGWGIARKIFQSSQNGNYTTCRRCWGRWDGSHWIGPKSTFKLSYNNYDMLIENSIATWSGRRMQATYVLGCYPVAPKSANSPSCGQTYTNYAVDQPTGLFRTTAPVGSIDVRSKVLGSIGYITNSDTFKGDSGFSIPSVDGIELTNNVIYMASAYTNKLTFKLPNPSAGGTNLIARHLTGIGGAGTRIGSDWVTENIEQGPTTASVSSIYNSPIGARICYRYQDGVLTSEPLWPWPMNQRIIDAMQQSGIPPVDVTQTIEQLFGPIPGECRE